MLNFHLQWAQKTGGVRPPPSLYMEMGIRPLYAESLIRFPPLLASNETGTAIILIIYVLLLVLRILQIRPSKGTYQVCPDVSYYMEGIARISEYKDSKYF